MKKILLFGSSGFIGTNLKLYFQNNQTYKLIIPLVKNKDILSSREIKKVIKKISPDFIINAAYYGGVSSSIHFSRVNINKNLGIIQAILEGSRRISSLKKIIFFGSSLEYADSKAPLKETDPIGPKNTYAAIKSVSTLLSLALARELDLPLILIRPFNLYGPYDRKSVIYYLIKAIINRKPFQITKGGQIRDYLFIEDFVKIIAGVIENYQKFKNYEIYNIGSGKPTKLKTVFSLIFQLTNFKGKIKYTVNNQNEYWHQVADIEKIKNQIKLNSPIPLILGLKKTLAWFKSTESVKI